MRRWIVPAVVVLCGALFVILVQTANTPTAAIGTPVRDGKLQFTVTKVEVGRTRVGNTDIHSKEARGQFVLVYMTVTNVGDTARQFLDARLFDAHHEFSADTGAADYLDRSQSFRDKISPGDSVNGIIVFDVPKDVKPRGIKLHESALSAGVHVEFG